MTSIFKNSIIIFICTFLSFPLYCMSRDSDVDPTKTYIDEYGIDTGLSEDEFIQFENGYKKRLQEIFPGHTNRRFKDHFNLKIDLNKYEKLKKIGCYKSRTYQYNALHSDIIVIGKSKIDNLELIRKDSLVFVPFSCIEIQEILKGSDILIAKYDKIPKKLYYPSYNIMEERYPIYNQKGLYFLWTANMLSESRPYLQQKTNSPILFSRKYGHTIERFIKKPEEWAVNMKSVVSEDTLARSEEKWNDLIRKIKMIIEFNDAKNFYKRNY